MSVSNYKPSDNMCKYTYSKLKNVVYLVSREHVKNVYIDNGEAYCDNITELPLRLNGFDINLNEESSLDERYQFQKTVTLSMHGYVSSKLFSSRYYVILESEDGTFWMVNIDFPSRVTYTFNLSNNIYQTDFTFASLSNFPTLRLHADFEAVEPPCLGFNTYGIKSLQLIEKDNAALDTNNKTVYTYGTSFKNIEFLGESCTYSSVYDGFNVTDTITFDIAFDVYKSSWHYNLIEFIQNLYSAVITPKTSDNLLYSGFNYGLQPNFTVQTSDSNDASDVITITLRETSPYGLTAAKDWSEQQSTDTRWVNVRQVDNTVCWECVARGKARYLVQREVLTNGVSTGNYRVLEGYESRYADILNVTGTFDTDEIFDEASCNGEQCHMTTSIPLNITFTSATCYDYSFTSDCDWSVTNDSFLSVSPSSGTAGNNYTIHVCNSLYPTGTTNASFTINSGGNARVVNVTVTNETNILNPSGKDINCERQNVIFTFDPTCPITVTSIPDGLTYSMTQSQLIINVPANRTTSSVTYSVSVKNCNNNVQTVSINQDKVYERWVTVDGYLCDGSTSYTIEDRYTGTTPSYTNTPTGERRMGTVIQTNDPNCSTMSVRWTASQYYICIDGDKWSFEEEEISYDNGSNWTKTGVIRPVAMVEEDASMCGGDSQGEEWRITTRWQCGT